MVKQLAKSDIDLLGLCHRPQNQPLWGLFFADTALERRPARNLCSSCPVRLECLTWALEHNEVWGVWGGCDESELRRALWVNSNGKAAERCRYPHCPACHARPNRLYVSATCELKSGRRKEQVECSACGFSWRAGTSVSAVKAYWRFRRRELRAAKKSTVASRRLPRPGVTRLPAPVPLPVPASLPEEPLVALVAAGSRNSVPG